MDRDKIAERILHLTLEILFRLTGEDYTVVKKISSEGCQDPVSEGWGRPLSPITGPPPYPLMHEDINDQKILELTFKMIELLTGEVPIRCQDVAVYFSLEEWEYLEGRKNLYKDVVMEVPQPLTSPVLSSKRTTPERCPCPLLPQDFKQENLNVPQDHQGEDLTHINTTETYVRGDERCKEEIPTDNRPDDCTRGTECQQTSYVFNSDDLNLTQDKTEVNVITPDSPSSLHCKDLSSDPFTQVLSSDSSQTITKNKSRKEVECGKYSNQKSDLDKHETIHTGTKSFRSESGNWFEKESNNMKHQSIPIGEKLFLCSECGKCFANKSNLVRHYKLHTGEKPFSCSECGKCFVDKSHFVTHKRSHTGEKPYKCSECGKCFRDKSDVVRHQKIHREERPYSCSECGKCFAEKSNLVNHHRIHQSIHTGVNQFSCSECGKCFVKKSNLVRHYKLHTAEKFFSC
ncbi:oocyte zinc finger protein XlCOF8.4-like [Ranitomeya imitator]|uniref:oocyte zinc finger protein XlCOF8.4-like n=1 Tax=Ranitomeya imitator TaxID=111125 RepID=UPI0037E97634